MYTPRAFASNDPAALDALLAADPFVTLVTVVDGAPVVSHLPVLIERDGGRLALRGHWAKPNPQSSHTGPALAIVHGPHAYVSPSWYTDKVEETRVPTWNYVVAHLHGTLERLTGTDDLASIVADLSARFETQVGEQWRYVDDDAHRSQLRGIVGFRLHVDRIDTKVKLSQNHPDANREAVIGKLGAQDTDDARSVAQWMREALAASRAGDRHGS
ncbi:FMN-binding negative transcriptional regulator [Lysobacter dokdonensis DS-58]|uniref:FMN-binding negative transcriptional regulator n=1 Tax=Lysobacter dokdonensis DS-58 TaxID=1300345 RepID=A0A0A2WPS6_9GAMM|nr:FMN-binding negative transcriptional regulator [Lysobacter dokdonensis]KGQ20290.1 FMN-binding negative transcriptional regulator [Lysobacter dokdonensis DS-58]